MSLRTRLTSVALASVVALGVVALGAPAQADTIKVKLPVSGSTVVKKQNATLTLPSGGALTGDFDLAAGTLTNGQLSIPQFTAKIRIFGIPFFGDTTSTVALQQVKPTTAAVQADGTVKAQTTLRLNLPKVTSDRLPFVNLVKSTCRTKDFPVTLQSSNTFDLSTPLQFTSTFTLPDLTECGLSEKLLSGLLSGPGNTLKLSAGPVQTQS